jgi:hypothetical protein
LPGAPLTSSSSGQPYTSAFTATMNASCGISTLPDEQRVALLATTPQS